MKRAAAALIAALMLTGCGEAIEPPAPVTSASPERRELAPPAPAPNPRATPPKQAPVPVRPATYAVTRVVDGDTIYADIDGVNTGIRIIGLNTPETVAPNTGVQCYGPEASAAAKEALTGQRVRLVRDPTQDDEDRYGRALYYVDLADGTDFGAYMIRNGFAREYTYARKYERQAEYRAAQAQAQAGNDGLWGACP